MLHQRRMHTLIRQAAGCEAEPTVDVRVTDEGAAGGPTGCDDSEPVADKPATDASTLALWVDGERTEAEPRALGVRDENGRESDMTHYSSRFLCNEGQCQVAGSTQRTDDGSLRSRAIGLPLERIVRQVVDGIDVGRLLQPDDRISCSTRGTCHADSLCRTSAAAATGIRPRRPFQHALSIRPWRVPAGHPRQRQVVLPPGGEMVGGVFWITRIVMCTQPKCSHPARSWSLMCGL